MKKNHSRHKPAQEPYKRVSSRTALKPKPRPLHPKERKAIEKESGTLIGPRESESKKYGAPAGTTAEKSEWLKKCWSKLGLPKEAITLPRSLPDPVDSGFGESYTTVQMHYGEFLLKALSKRKKNDPNLLLSPVHLSLLKSIEIQFSKPHLAPLRAALVAIHLRSAGEKHHLILQCKRVSSAVISSAKKFSSWSLREMETIVGVHLLHLDSPKPVALGLVPPNAKLRTLEGDTRLSLPFSNWEKPLLLHPLEGGRGHRPLWSKMVQESVDLLQLRAGETLIDLCSGSGVFALEGLSRGASVIALDRKRGVGEMLNQNARLQKFSLPTFVQAELSAKSVASILEKTDQGVKVVLDLPGVVAPAGVPTEFANAEVSRILRVYSTPKQLASEFGRWKYNGYMLHKVRCYDMHPRAPGLEFIALYRWIGKEQIAQLKAGQPSRSTQKARSKKNPTGFKTEQPLPLFKEKERKKG